MEPPSANDETPTIANAIAVAFRFGRDDGLETGIVEGKIFQAAKESSHMTLQIVNLAQQKEQLSADLDSTIEQFRACVDAQVSPYGRVSEHH